MTTEQIRFDKTALRCENGKGLIGFYGLAEWFNETFSEAEILYIKEKLSTAFTNPDLLTNGTISSATQSPYSFLTSMAYNFKTKKDLSYAIRFLKKAEEIADLGSMTAYDIHYLCMTMIEIYYKDREHPESFEKTVYWCKKMIEVAPNAYKEIIEFNDNLYSKEDKKTLPKELIESAYNPPHIGFEQLAIIEYKRGNYEEVIKICKLAKKSKFRGEWDERIEKAQKKLQK